MPRNRRARKRKQPREWFHWRCLSWEKKPKQYDSELSGKFCVPYLKENQWMESPWTLKSPWMRKIIAPRGRGKTKDWIGGLRLIGRKSAQAGERAEGVPEEGYWNKEREKIDMKLASKALDRTMAKMNPPRGLNPAFRQGTSVYES